MRLGPPTYRALRCGFFHLAVIGQPQCLCGYYEAPEYVDNAVQHGCAAWITHEHWAAKVAKYGDFYAYQRAHQEEVAKKRQAVIAARAESQREREAAHARWDKERAAAALQPQPEEIQPRAESSRRLIVRRSQAPHQTRRRELALVTADSIEWGSTLLGCSWPKGLEKLFRVPPPSRWGLTPTCAEEWS